jgi:hypothetical protein
MDPVNAAPRCFAPDYASARVRFLAACETARIAATPWQNPGVGPRGEALFTDTAWCGPEDAGGVLVLVSATHGVEGFPGSAAQVDWLLNARPQPLPENTAVLLVHAINPHGFAWLRRVTEEGVDLNRNFVDFAAPLPANPGYDALASALVPEAYGARHGDTALMMARSAGQYAHPGGMFYGGTGPTWSRRTLQGIVEHYAMADREVVGVVDFHTGLGPFGYGEPICDHTLGTPNAARALAWWGRSVTQPQLGNSASVPKMGLSEIGWERMLGERVSFVALEYGTTCCAGITGCTTTPTSTGTIRASAGSSTPCKATSRRRAWTGRRWCWRAAGR